MKIGSKPPCGKPVSPRDTEIEIKKNARPKVKGKKRTSDNKRRAARKFNVGRSRVPPRPLKLSGVGRGVYYGNSFVRFSNGPNADATPAKILVTSRPVF